MDFNIDNESFAAAYRCLRNANELLEVGLGDFSELKGSALSLVGLGDKKNNDRLLNLTYKCTKLKDNMYNTIKYLSMMDASVAEFFDDILNDDIINSGDLNVIDDIIGSVGGYDLWLKQLEKEYQEGYNYGDVGVETGLGIKNEDGYVEEILYCGLDKNGNPRFVIEKSSVDANGIQHMIALYRKVGIEEIIRNKDRIVDVNNSSVTLPWTRDDENRDVPIKFLLDEIERSKEEENIVKFAPIKGLKGYKGDSGFAVEPDNDYREMDPGFYIEPDRDYREMDPGFYRDK